MFEQQLTLRRALIEYGSGGSTLFAAAIAERIVSVESDPRFAGAIEKAVAGCDADVRVIRGNLGVTEGWGIPLFQRNRPRRLARWRKYITDPWDCVADLGWPDVTPPLVLIDGRFRVATAAFSLLQLLDEPEAVVLVDDYAVRPNYWALESVSIIRHRAGRSILLSPLPGTREALQSVVEEFATDWR